MKIFAKKPDYMIPETGVNLVEKVTIGDIEQTILIQSHNASNPLLLFLHGGPSLPLPGVSSRGRDYTITMNTKELVKHFTVVFWDQRGTGKSYHKDIPQASMTFEQLVADALELTNYLREKFNQEKIFLAAHSFGALIGIYLVGKNAELFHSYVGLSQVISWTENDKLCLKWAKEEAERRSDKKALKELTAVGEPPFTESVKQWGVLRKWQTRNKTMVYSDKEIKHPGLVKTSLDMILSKEYRLKDTYNSVYKGFKLIYTQDFIESLPGINAKDEFKEINIPVTFIHGRKDVHVHAELVEDFYQNLQSPDKRIIWVDKSAHLFHPDDTKIIENILIEELRHM